jgi:hypothetical protein
MDEAELLDFYWILLHATRLEKEKGVGFQKLTGLSHPNRISLNLTNYDKDPYRLLSNDRDAIKKTAAFRDRLRFQQRFIQPHR